MVSILIDTDMLLRSYQPDDVQELFNAINESHEHLKPWLNWVDKTTRQEHSLQFIHQSIHELEAQEGLALGIFYKRRIIGGIGMHHWDHTIQKAQLGYWISKDYQGKGIIYNCMLRFIDFLFEKVGLNKIEIHFVPQNIRSANVARQLNFTIEGILRQSCLRNGNLEDIVISGLLKNEWHNKLVHYNT